MRHDNIVVIFALLLLTTARAASAYETETHAAITLKAYDSSVLMRTGPGSVINILGLDRLYTSTPFNIYWRSVPLPNSYYMDGGASCGFQVGQGIGSSDQPEEFERCQMREFSQVFNNSIPREYQIFGNTVSVDTENVTTDPILPIQNWIVRGAIREDDMGSATWWFTNEVRCGLLWRLTAQFNNLKRSLNHFYDPYSNIGLNTLLASGKKSVDWALGYVDSFANPPQVDGSRQNFYSYTDARNMFWWALSRENNKANGVLYDANRRSADAVDRLFLWDSMFRSLGDVLHLLEDTAQPQHTRNDPHGGPFVSVEQASFEPYTNARILGGGSVGTYVQSFYGDEQVALTPPPLGTYGAVSFATPVRFFSTRGDNPNQATRAGLADYTNRGFFTGGTQPGSTVEPLPPRDLTTGYTVVNTPCEGLENSSDMRLRGILCKHYTMQVPDQVNSGYQDDLPPNYTLPPLASASVMMQINVALGAGQLVPTTAMGIAELDTTGNLTIPRAVGYATGMINFFFRGQLAVTPPSGGIYAIVNHGTPHTVDADGIPHLTSNPNLVFGFTALRLQVKNTTPPIYDAGTQSNVTQSTGGSGAKMVAVARYHRNPCYLPDLSGQWSSDEAGGVHAPVNCPSSRTAYPEISVSAEVPVAAGMLDGQQPVEQQFDFSNDPIPINATDLFIQVAYRGALGSETDGIAVGMVDVSEPSYESNLAMTDIPLQYQEDGLTWKWGPWTSPPWSAWTLPNGHSWAYPPPDPIADLAVTHIEICDGSSQIYLSAPGEQLPENHVVRIAAIRDFTSHTITGQVTFQGQFAGPSTVSSYTRTGGDINQDTNEQGGSMHTTYLFYGRGVVGAGDIDFISTCANPYPNTDCLAPPSPPPSPYAQSPSPLPLPNITPPAAGFISESIGNVTLPITNGSAACTIQGSGLPYAPRLGSPGARWMSAGRAAAARTQ